MTLGKLRAAKREATWFLEELRILENRLEKDGDNLLWGGCRESGAVRRWLSRNKWKIAKAKIDRIKKILKRASFCEAILLKEIRMRKF